MNKRIGSDDRYTDAPPEIAEALAASEPVEDDFPSPEELARELSRTITIRLDPAVYEWFRRPGPGYQTRINAVLRYYVRTQKAKAGHPETGRAVSVARKRSPVGRANDRKAAAKRKQSARR
ncbi:MAG: BrnA antitoxin family protein [Spirochaetia bacterium]|jgi:uncharacterized protein (DUF4415 family)